MKTIIRGIRMTDKTWDTENPRELPYRFVYSPVTDEVFIIGLGRGMAITAFFENREAFHRFLLEGIETEHKITSIGLYQAGEILKAKQLLLLMTL